MARSPRTKYKTFKTARSAATLISLMVVFSALMPSTAKASVISAFLSSIKWNSAQADVVQGPENLQTMQVLKPAMNLDPAPAVGGGDITIVGNSALVPEEGPSGTIADIEKPKNSTISRYVVRDGDTLSGIASMFGVSNGTILSANDLPTGSKLHPGEVLVILPITGIDYTVKKGDTLESIAKAYGGDPGEIASQNGLDNATLAFGSTIIIPNGEAPAPAQSATGKKSVSHARGVTGPSSVFANNPREPAHNVGPVGTATEVAYYIAPVSGYRRTQGIHGYNAVDLAAPIGTPIVAAADGTVVVARAGGWNGGYGSYVVVSHGNGSQTLYGHMSKVAAYDGQEVHQGEVIGYVGRTGEATGPHVHFEIRNGIRNPF